MLIAIPQGVWGQITVAGNEPNDAGNFEDLSGVTFNSQTSTLTLSNATINGSISISSAIEELAINLVGSNTLNGNITGSVINDGYTSLSFTGEGECSLKITTENSALNLISYKLASGLYLASDDPAPYIDDNGSLRGGDGSAVSSITISTTETYPIWVYTGAQSTTTGYTQLTAENSSVNGTESGTASYNGSILTLTNFACMTTGDGTAFYIGQEIENLTVNLSGENTINGSGISFVNANASLVLSADTQTPGSLTVNGSSFTSSNTLTLNNVTLNGNVLCGLGDLTLKIIGNNTINGDANGCLKANGYDKTLKFEKGGDNSSLTLSCTGDDRSVIQGFSGVSYNNMYLQTSDPNIYDIEDNVLVTQTSGAKINSATITSEVSYPIWMGINHTQLTAANNQESAVFDGTNKLTLTDYNESDVTYAFYIGQGIKNLEAHLVGTNHVYGSGFYFAENNPSLTFTTADTPGSFEVSGNIAVCNNAGIINIACENGLVLNDKKVSADGVRVKIGSVSVSSTTEDVLGDGNVSFVASTNTLTLSGASIPYEQDKEVMVYVDNLKVNISGENAIDVNIRYSGQNHNTSSIQINKASNEGTPRLTVPNIQGFASCTCGEGLYLTGHDAQDNVIDVHYEHFENGGGSMQSYFGTISDVTFSTTESNTIWVAGIMSAGGDITGEGITTETNGTVTYNATDRILTLTNVSLSTSETNPLIICNGNLTVNLVGKDNNTYFNNCDETYIFKNNGTTGTLTFKGTGILGLNSSYSAGTYKGLCDGFTEVEFNDDLGLFNQADTKYVKNITGEAPGFSLSDGVNYWAAENGLLLNATYHYKIDYVDTSIEGSGVEVDLPLDQTNYNFNGATLDISDLTPCTITSYAKMNGNIIGSKKAKLFGPAAETQRIVCGEASSLALVPAIEEGDGIKISGIDSAIEFDEETQKITASGLGSETLYVSLQYVDEEYTPGNTIILNSESIRMQVEVVRDLGIEFVGSNLWASYYATETLAVPEGLTAYVVSAVNEKTGAVTVESVDYIPANNAVLLQRAANGAASGYTAAAYTGTTGTVNNLLSGSTQETAVSSIANSPVYVLFNDKFKRATSGTIPARRAYLALGAAVAPSGAPRFMNISIGDGSVTAIKTVAVDDNSNDSWYTIDGLKLNGKPQRKCLYFNKGKKMYINNNK